MAPFNLDENSDASWRQQEMEMILRRDSKHALKNPNSNERLLGVRANQLFEK